MQITFIEDEQGNVSERVVNQKETEMRAKRVVVCRRLFNRRACREGAED